MIWMIVPCSQGFTKFQLNLSYLGYNTEEGAMLRSVAGTGRSILILSYFCGEPQPVRAIFSGRGKTKKGFLCTTLCDMKMDGLLDLYQM